MVNDSIKLKIQIKNMRDMFTVMNEMFKQEQEKNAEIKHSQ